MGEWLLFNAISVIFLAILWREQWDDLNFDSLIYLEVVSERLVFNINSTILSYIIVKTSYISMRYIVLDQHA